MFSKNLEIVTANGVHEIVVTSRLSKKGNLVFDHKCLSTAAEDDGKFPSLASVDVVHGNHYKKNAWKLHVKGSGHGVPFTAGRKSNDVSAVLHCQDGDEIMSITFKFAERSDGGFNPTVSGRRLLGEGQRGRKSREAVSADKL